MVKRCHIFTSKWEENTRAHSGNMFKKLIYVSCWALHLQFKQNSTLPPHRVYFIRYEGVTRSCVIKTVINWKEKVPPEFWEAVNFICLTALLLVLFSVWAYFVLKSDTPCHPPPFASNVQCIFSASSLNRIKLHCSLCYQNVTHSKLRLCSVPCIV